MNNLTSNILSVYNRASPAQLEEGMSWYKRAHAIAKDLANEFFLASSSHSAGIIAVLSPAVQWEVNVRDARTVCASRQDDLPKVSTYGQFLHKAIAIRDGSHPKKWINPVTAPKTHAFWKTITRPWEDEHVVVDRHALAVCLGRALTDKERGSLLRRVGAYQMYSNAYKEAASIVGVKPNQIQAVTWTVWRQAA